MKLSKNQAKKQYLTMARIIIMMMCVMLLAGISVSAVDNDLKENDANTNTGVVNGAVEIKEYNFKAKISKDHSYKVKEVITVNLPADTQYIDFNIPNGNFRVEGIKVENSEYEIDEGQDLSKVRITDAKKLTKGSHVYTIEYTVREYADRDSTKDIFYFDVLLPGWEQPIGKVDIMLNFPEDFPMEDMQYYAGQFGVQNVNSKIGFDVNDGAKTVHITATKLPENFGITVKANLPNGYWQGQIDGIWAIKAMLIVMGGTLMLLLLMWLIGGRDPRIPKMLQDHPVEGVTPVEIGYIFTGSIHTRDIMCWIVYMAEKGYLKISEYKPKKFKLIRKKYPDEEEKFIRNAYDILFEDIPEDRGIQMDEIGPRLRRLRKLISEDVAAGFSSKDMLAYKPLSKVFRIAGAIFYGIALGLTAALRFYYDYQVPNYAEAIVVGLLAISTALFFCRERDRQYFSESKQYRRNIIFASVLYVLVPAYVVYRIGRLTGQWAVAVIVFILALLCGLFILLMRARAKGNAELTTRFMQMRHFIYHPTPKEVAKNYLEDKNYYYHMVPYALMFNGLETWSISFLTIPLDPPDWYSDDIEGHAHSAVRTDNDVLNFAKDMKSFYRTMIYSYQQMIRKHRKG